MEYLRQQIDAVPLDSVQARSSGFRVAITFDDGYADNARVAKPILEGLGLPATFFISVGVVGSQRGFWWDRLTNLVLLASSGLTQVDVDVGGRRYLIRLDSPVAREQAHTTLHRRLRRLPPEFIERILDELASSMGSEPGLIETTPVLAREELASMTSDLVEVGAHTISHPLLSAQPFEDQKTEINGGRRMLERLIQENVRLFSYPFGGRDAFNKQTLRLVEEGGYTFACTGVAGRVSSRTHPLALPRHFVHNWEQAEFAGRLSDWFGTR